MKYLSLFSGIGAFESALKRNGVDIELVGFSEIDKYAIKSYCAIHSVDESLNLGDISKINLDDLDEDIELITHGSPCQDFSLAGLQRGGDKGSETRSSLMWCTVDIVEKVRPKYVVWENVKNLLSKAHRHNFDSYLEVMESLGYNNYYKVLNAKDYGIPQNRERVFTISIRKDIDKKFVFPEKQELKLKLKDMLEDNVDEKYYLSGKMIKYISADNEKWTGNNKEALINKDIATTINTGEGSRRCDASNYISNELPQNYNLKIKNNTKQGYLLATNGDGIDLEQPNSTTRRGKVQKEMIQTLNTQDNKAVVLNDLRIRKLTPKECWRLMGFSDEDFEKARAIGTSNTQLYKQAGNSIVVNVLEAVFKEMRW